MDHASNAFERYAAEQASPARRSRVRVVTSEKHAPMVPTAMEKEKRDQAIQFTKFKKAMRADHQALLNSEHGKDYAALIAILKQELTPVTAKNLALHIKQASWIKRCDQHQRHTILSIIDAKIIRHRELQGLPPMDDAIFDEPPNLFLIIRKAITGV